MANKEYLPFKTINVFIERNNLREILEFVIKNVDKLPKEDQISFGNSFREYVSILGFRNPLRAPLPLQVNAYVRAFEDMDEVIPFTLTSWTKLRSDFAEKVKDWLKSEGWEDLQLEREYDETSGFIREWPESLTFEKLNDDFAKANPNLDYDQDELLVMILWISGKLPDEDYRL